MITITGRNAPALFREALYKMRTFALEENSRNGPVRSILSPVVLRLMQPDERVITDPTRDANPFFHVMEFVWMMAGSNDIQWIAHFNKNMLNFSDNGVTQHAAYGARWRNHFWFDQIKGVIKLLKENPLDRRLVINTWDPEADLGHSGVDVPCNTQLLFRVVDGELQMSVINRSNDLIWGALGANICHMTMLQELIARSAGLPMGEYYVFTQNLHIYESVPNFDYYMGGAYSGENVYARQNYTVRPYPLLSGNETYADFVEDCLNMVGLPKQPSGPIRTQWMRNVAAPMHKVWWGRKAGLPYDTNEILADDWRIACEEWISRRNATVGDKRRDYYAGVLSRQQMAEGVDISSLQPDPLAGVDSSQPDVGTTTPESGTDGAVSTEPL